MFSDTSYVADSYMHQKKKKVKVVAVLKLMKPVPQFTLQSPNLNSRIIKTSSEGISKSDKYSPH